MTEVWRLLFRGQIGLLFLAALALDANVQVAVLLMPLFTVRQGGDAFTAGLHTALFTASGIILRFYFGPLADRRGRKLPLMIGALVFSSAALVAPLIRNLWGLAALRLYQGIGLASYSSTLNSLVVDLAPHHLRATALSLIRSASWLSLMVAPGFAEYVIRNWGFNDLLVGVGVLGLGSLMVFGLAREPARSIPHRRPPALGGLDLLGDASLRRALVGVVGCGLGLSVLMTFMPLYAQATGFQYGAFFFVYALGGLLVGPPGARLADRIGRTRIVSLALRVFAVALATAVFIGRRHGLVLLTGALAGAAGSVALSTGAAQVADSATFARRGTAMALYETAIDIPFSLGLVVMGSLARMAGYPFLFGVTAACVALTTVYLSWQPRRNEKASERESTTK
jgi:MFS family permease